MKKLILIACLSLIPTLAIAQTPPKPRPALTGDVKADIKNAISPNQNAASNNQNDACNFNLLASLKADNLFRQIHNCIQTTLFEDVSAALASATEFKDQPGIACLKPALEIIKAAKGTDAIPANDTANPPTLAVAAIEPGPILLFQKFREFQLSGGPAACKTWVNSTILNPLSNL